MKYTIECPYNATVTVYLKGGMKIHFECDYEYGHSHQIENAEIEAVILSRGNDQQIIFPSDPEFSSYIAADETVHKEEQCVSGPSRYSVSPQFQNVEDEPENIDKVSDSDGNSGPILNENFLRAQLSTKHQMIIRNALAIASSLVVSLMYILEKLGII